MKVSYSARHELIPREDSIMIKISTKWKNTFPHFVFSYCPVR